MIKNIVFDIGNVLVDFGWKAFIESFGFSDEVNQRVIKATVLNGAWNEYDRGVLSEEEIVDGFVKNDPGIETELRKMCENFNGLLTQFEYAKGLIKDLQNKGFKVYALSNMSYKAVRECADALNFLPMMDGYILSCNEKLIKPDHAIYELLYSRFKLDPKETVFFDDTEKNIVAAKETGMHGIVFKDLKQAMGELNELIKEEMENGEFKSSYTKAQRVGAVICLSLIAVLIIAVVVFTLIDTPWKLTAVKISLGSMLVIPILTWIYIWMIGKLTHKKTIADFNFFEER